MSPWRLFGIDRWAVQQNGNKWIYHINGWVVFDLNAPFQQTFEEFINDIGAARAWCELVTTATRLIIHKWRYIMGWIHNIITTEVVGMIVIMKIVEVHGWHFQQTNYVNGCVDFDLSKCTILTEYWRILLDTFAHMACTWP